MRTISLLILLACLLWVTGCNAQPLRPGKIEHHVRTATTTIPLTAKHVDLLPPELKTLLHAEKKGFSLRVDTREESTVVTQPQNPASGATLKNADLSASLPGSHRPPAPPTPVDNWLGLLAWGAGVVLAAGIFLQVCRFFPGIPLLAAMPKGVAQGMIVGGGSLLAVVTFLDRAPTWLIGLTIGAGLLVAVVVGQWDNLKTYFAGLLTSSQKPVKQEPT